MIPANTSPASLQPGLPQEAKGPRSSCPQPTAFHLPTAPEPDFDALVQLAAHIARTPVALILITDGECSWAKAAFGLRREEAPTHSSFSEATLIQPGLLLVADASADERFARDPLVAGTSTKRWRAYAGAPLISPTGEVLGLLCAVDFEPRAWTDAECVGLGTLARQVVAQMEWRRVTEELARNREALERSLRDSERTERALSESEDRFYSLANSAPVMIWTTGPSASPTFFNRAWLEFAGQPLAKALQDGWRSLMHPEDLPEYLDVFASAFKAQQPFRLAYRLRRADGEFRWIEDVGVPWFAAGGTFAGYIGAAFDVSDHREHEAQVENLNRELEERVVERTAALQAANQELEDFAHSISHDLRAPLRAISGFSSILLDTQAERLGPDGAHCLKLVKSGADNMQRLINDLLKFARYSRQPVTRTVLNLAPLAQSVITELQRTHADRSLRFQVASLPDCEGDSPLLRQVLFNLLDNAVKFTQRVEAPLIEVGWEPATADGTPAFFVRDNGVGFDMNYANKLFGVFQRLHSAEDYEGTGVGLSIVHRIVHRHGGNIWARSQPGRGATFYFTLPSAPAAGRLSNQPTPSVGI